MKPITFVRERTFAMSVREAWQLLSDTDSLNRFLHLPPFDFSSPGGLGVGFVRRARARVLGITVRWREYPFDWVRERRYSVRREFEGGPLSAVEGGVEFRPDGDGARIKVFSEFTPANFVGILLVPFFARRNVRQLFAYCERYLELKRVAGADPRPLGSVAPSVDRSYLDRLLLELRDAPINAHLLPPVRKRILEGADAQVLRIRPYELADEWGVERSEVLGLFLHATRAGLFELRWQLMCPNCRIPKGEARSLRELPESIHCDTCMIDYSTDFDSAVEARFSVHPRVRLAEEVIHCIGGPFRTRHVVAQQTLRPGERRIVTTPSDQPLLLRRIGQSEALRLIPELDATDGREVTFTYLDRRWSVPSQTKGEDEASIPMGQATLLLHNDSEHPVVALIEEAQRDPQAATAAEITALQEFRDLFGAEVLAPGQEIAIRSMALLFTDLKGSTSLYEQLGDAPAYGRVNRHFELLKEEIAGHRGSIVKTIGDAVMGAFTSVEDAVDAAFQIQTRIGAWCGEHGINPPLILRMGLHEGPAIAVNANERLDYFGRTVNIAARVEGQSEGGDVVMLMQLFQDERVQTAAKPWTLDVEPFEAQLRGLGTAKLVRLRPTESDSR